MGTYTGRRLEVELSDRRRPVPFFIATWSGDGVAMLSSNDLGLDGLKRSLACLDKAFEKNGGPNRSTNYELNYTTRLRVVPLSGEISSAYAVFVESVATRASIDVMIERFRLTRREAEVLRLVVTGNSGPEIGKILFITAATVSDHTSSLLRKIGVRRRLELVMAMQECAHTTPWNSDQGLSN